MRGSASQGIAVGVLSVLAFVVACERPPVAPPPDDNEPPPPGRVGPVAIETFTQDRPAIAGKWFEYDPDGHTLTPKDQAWIVRERVVDDVSGAPTDRYFAFRITNIYESDAAESGLFTLGVAVHDDVAGAWGSEEEWVTPRNVKLTGAMCVDVFTRTEVACTDEGWQLRLAVFSYFSPLAGIAVAEPGVYVRSVAGTDAFGDVKLARLDGVTALASLPDPVTLGELDDGAPAAWDGTDWSFAQLAPDLPLAGMAVGDRVLGANFTSTGDVLWLMTSRFTLYRVQVAPVSDGDVDGGLRLTFSAVDVDRGDFTAPDTMPGATSVDVALPSPGSARYLSLRSETLDLAEADLAGVVWPHAPPLTTKWDLALERPRGDADGSDVRLLVSPASAVLNATQLGLDENLPPVSTP